MSNKTLIQPQAITSKRRPLRYLIALPAVSLALVLAPAPSNSPTGAMAAGLSKRFLRFNEYLFNGIESTTAIAAITADGATADVA